MAGVMASNGAVALEDGLVNISAPTTSGVHAAAVCTTTGDVSLRNAYIRAPIAVSGPTTILLAGDAAKWRHVRAWVYRADDALLWVDGRNVSNGTGAYPPLPPTGWPDEAPPMPGNGLPQVVGGWVWGLTVVLRVCAVSVLCVVL